MSPKIYLVLCVVGLLLGLASPLPIWWGPILYRHLTPAIISAILVIVACLGAMKKGSKAVGIISLVYGVLATVFGALLSVVIFPLLVGSTGTEYYTPVLILGTVLAIAVGITAIVLGFKTYKNINRKI